MDSGAIAEGPVTRVNIGRLTNAIFAFTLLLLFKNVRTPTFGDYIANMTANDFGLMQLPDIASFLNAFIIIAMIWVITFHIFHQMARVDRTYLYIHLGTMMMLIFIPVSSHMNVMFPEKSIFPVLFHLNMLVIGILLGLTWWHITRDPTVCRHGLSPGQLRCTGIKTLFIPITACFGIILASLDLPYTQGIYLVTMLAFALTTVYSRTRKEIGRRQDS
jgi:uncharacterized membrane protein